MGGRFIRFCVIGMIGFVVDALVLFFVVHVSGINPLGARLISFAVAVLVTFELNRRWTFASQGGGTYWSQIAGYVGVQSVGFSCNLGVYTAMYLLLRPASGALFVALCVASAVALFVNYMGAAAVVFRKREARPRSFGS